MSLDPLRRALGPALQRVLHFYWRFARGLTMGVRAIVIDPQGRVFLVKHSYVAGWHLPGGGVETGETIGDALSRELIEEGGITPLAPPVLHGMFFNARTSRRDHVAVFVVREFRQRAGRDTRTRSSITGSSRPAHCPSTRRAARALALPKCSTARPVPSAGDTPRPVPCAPH